MSREQYEQERLKFLAESVHEMQPLQDLTSQAVRATFDAFYSDDTESKRQRRKQFRARRARKADRNRGERTMDW